MRRGKIFLGDLATAVAALDAGDDAADRIAQMLGLALPPAVQEAVVSGMTEDSAQRELTMEPPEATGTLSSEEAATFLPSRIKHRSVGTAKLKRISFGTSAALPPSTSEEDEPAPPFEPLLRRLTSRAILSHALSTRRVTGIDVDRLVERIARRERFDPLPLRWVATMRRGVQVLIDASTGMTLFRRDQAALSEWIEKVVGKDRFTIGSFIGTPLLRFFGATPRARYTPPASHTPVILLTDLGIGRPRRLDNAAAIDEWLAFAEQLRRAHCPGIAFVPYPRARWPLRLRRTFTIHEWDRALTASHARQKQ